MRVADHKRHGHGLAQRPAQAQHDAADDAHAGKGDHDPAQDLPRGAAEPIGRLPSGPAGTVSKTSRVIEVMNGSTMMARISAAVRMPMP